MWHVVLVVWNDARCLTRLMRFVVLEAVGSGSR